ncbi:hypothetical protein Tco_0281349, partial [Tanacetum coccineum]
KTITGKAVAAPPPPSLPSRPQAIVGANTFSSNNDMMARGLMMRELEKRVKRHVVLIPVLWMGCKDLNGLLIG